jgi:hypothetical protein
MQQAGAMQTERHEVLDTTSDWFTGIMVSVFGRVGLMLAAGARDTEMSVFGWSLSAFSLVFVAGLLRLQFNAADLAAQKSAHHE